MMRHASLCWLLETSVRRKRRILQTDVSSSQHSILDKQTSAPYDSSGVRLRMAELYGEQTREN